MQNHYKEKYKANGVFRSAYDERDYKLSKLVKKAVRLPEKYMNPTPLIIADQGETGSCVAHAAAQAKHIIEYNQTGDTKEFSPMYIYGNRKLGDYRGSGMFPRQCLANLREYGMCHREDFEGLWEYEEAKREYLKDKNGLDRKAYPYRISSYYRLNTIEEMKTAIYTLGSAFLAYDVYDCLYEPDENGNINYDVTKQYKNYGGHQMLGVGYDETGFIVANSWGTDFGKNGLIHIPYDYPVSESWAIVDEITEQEVESKYRMTFVDKVKYLLAK